MQSLRRFGRWALAQSMLCLIRVYQLVLSPWLGNQCRFYPTCSHYAADAIKQHGPWRGIWLSAHRLSRCQPLAQGGMDPVPSTSSKDFA